METAKKNCEKLLNITNTLLGEKGCPWDKKQTLSTLKPYILEETYELLEALDEDDSKGIIEEAGDVLFQIFFISKLLEKEKRGTLAEILETIANKLILRHPHIFSTSIANTPEEVVKRWEEIKKEEKKRTSELEGIPQKLPCIAKMQKLMGKLKKKDLFKEEKINKVTEEEISLKLKELILQAVISDVDVESVVRKNIKELEKLF